jgi:hypothetical protein
MFLSVKLIHPAQGRFYTPASLKQFCQLRFLALYGAGVRGASMFLKKSEKRACQ